MLSCASYVQTTLEAPGKVREYGPFMLVIGELEKTAYSTCAEIVKRFQEADVPTEHVENVLEQKWKKLLWNVTFNPLSAISKARVGDILDDSYLRRTAENICLESIEVAQNKGISLEVQQTLDSIFAKAEYARKHQTSMLQDRLKQKRMEVESMCGYLVKKGNEAKIATPHLSTIYSVLNYIDQQIENKLVK
ncbi:ketopantoate reductase family protein [Salinibacillus xinjiangensis]|uniref:Ketopantoate reductase C-terminal domain-containing protein n=1 Tax=Salinibacillus xinjiangensis TaxID=1229268 RepID=A0A6G1X4T2_9BACI|nr:ketopantoate reductase C-terminal domain-containing protein [Salinibacillus xinjiangensis]MRG85952.1 hypothetical protein [Salinibacillus xinjiangensis]